MTNGMHPANLADDSTSLYYLYNGLGAYPNPECLTLLQYSFFGLQTTIHRKLAPEKLNT